MSLLVLARTQMRRVKQVESDDNDARYRTGVGNARKCLILYWGEYLRGLLGIKEPVERGEGSAIFQVCTILLPNYWMERG